MRYRVTAADRDTGQDITLELECAAAQEAEQQACSRGLLVSRVETMGTASSRSASWCGAGEKPRSLVRRWCTPSIVFVISLIALVAVAGIWGEHSARREVLDLEAENAVRGARATAKAMKDICVDGALRIASSMQDREAIDAIKAVRDEWIVANDIWFSILEKKDSADKLLMTRERLAAEKYPPVMPDVMLRLNTNTLRSLASRWR